jgi:hypothetical protein
MRFNRTPKEVYALIAVAAANPDNSIEAESFSQQNFSIYAQTR